jgi:hypothetical protein
MEWKLTGWFRCSHCGHIEEYTYHTMPEHDSCPVCRAVGFWRQVLEDDQLVDFDPKRHIS